MPKYSIELSKDPEVIYVADCRLDQESDNLKGQVAAYAGKDKWGKDKWNFYTFTVKPEQYNEKDLVPLLNNAIQMIGFHGFTVPKEAVKYAMRETQSIHIIHFMGWGHMGSDSCRYCDHGVLKKKWIIK